jgi:DNA polymerase III epsilon subunit-like protein
MIVHVIDTETTGLPQTPQAHVIEIGVATFEASQGLIGFWTSLVNPPSLASEEAEVAQKFHGISADQILSAPRFDEVWTELLAYARGYGEATWTAWNLPFDRCMVRRTFMGLDDFGQICAQLGAPEDLLKHSKYGWPERFDLQGDLLQWRECAMRAYSRQVRTKGSTRSWYTRQLEPNSWALAEAARREGVEFTGDAHRALTDATVAAKIYLKLLNGQVLPSGDAP